MPAAGSIVAAVGTVVLKPGPVGLLLRDSLLLLLLTLHRRLLRRLGPQLYQPSSPLVHPGGIRLQPPSSSPVQTAETSAGSRKLESWSGLVLRIGHSWY